MKKYLKPIFLIILITLPIVTLLFYIDSKQKPHLETEDTQEITVDKSETFSGFEDRDHSLGDIFITQEKEENEDKILQQTAWIPPWDYQNGLTSLKNFDSNFHSISPVTFQINNNGSLTKRLEPNLIDLKKICSEKNILLIPTISNFDSNMMKNIFDSDENTQRHIHSILQIVKEHDYDGIDLDYESIKAENKEDFLNFIKNLSKELRKENKLLSITVLPKWGEGVVYTASAETRKVQNWELIGEWADEVRIMAYDFTPVSSSKEGPIAPINWVEKILDYAVEKIPRDKIWLGIHLYSYEWVIPNTEGTNVKVNSYTYQVVKDRILLHDHVNIEYNKEYEEGFAKYDCLDNHSCMIYYATPESVKLRKQMADDYNIAGVAYWRLGKEGELIR